MVNKVDMYIQVLINLPYASVKSTLWTQFPVLLVKITVPFEPAFDHIIVLNRSSEECSTGVARHSTIVNSWFVHGNMADCTLSSGHSLHLSNSENNQCFVYLVVRVRSKITGFCRMQ